MPTPIPAFSPLVKTEGFDAGAKAFVEIADVAAADVEAAVVVGTEVELDVEVLVVGETLCVVG